LLGDPFQLNTYDKRGRPNRVVCPFSPEPGQEDIPFVELLRATGFTAVFLTTPHRFDQELQELVDPLRDGHFRERERAKMLGAGKDLVLTVGTEIENFYGTIRTWECVQAATATVLFYTTDLVEAYTKRVQEGKTKFKVLAYDVDCTDFDLTSAAFVPLRDISNYLEGGAKNEITFTENCPVCLGRNTPGGVLVTPSGTTLKEKVLVPSGSMGFFVKVNPGGEFSPKRTTVTCRFPNDRGMVTLDVPMVLHHRSETAPPGLKILERWQVPLTVAFAMTAPGAQGSQFYELIVDLRQHGDGGWIPHALYTSSSRGMRYAKIKFLNIPDVDTNKRCEKMVVVEAFLQSLVEERAQELEGRLATLDYAASVENIVIRANTNVDAEARRIYAARVAARKRSAEWMARPVV
jgi:hypothetical protein